MEREGKEYQFRYSGSVILLCIIHSDPQMIIHLNVQRSLLYVHLQIYLSIYLSLLSFRDNYSNLKGWDFILILFQSKGECDGIDLCVGKRNDGAKSIMGNNQQWSITNINIKIKQIDNIKSLKLTLSIYLQFITVFTVSSFVSNPVKSNKIFFLQLRAIPIEQIIDLSC